MKTKTASQGFKKGFKKGDQVRTIYGKTETVLSANESQVMTYESAREQAWHHTTKVTKTATI